MIINYSFSLNILEPFRTFLNIIVYQSLCVLDDKQVCKKTVFKKNLILMYVVPWFLCDVNSFSHHIQTKWKVLKKRLAF